MSSGLKALIFDYTGVLTDPLSIGSSPGSQSADEAPADEDPDAAARRKLRSMMGHELENPDPSGLWNRLERGETPLTELLQRIDEVVPGASVFFAGEGAASLMSRMTVRADVIDRLRAYKAPGLSLALLTNNVKEWRPLWTANLRASGGYDLFDVIIDSSEVGMRKPEPRIYTHTIGALGVDLHDCIFVDDFEQNVRGAEAIGICSLLATPDDAHWAALDSIVGGQAQAR